MLHVLSVVNTLCLLLPSTLNILFSYLANITGATVEIMQLEHNGTNQWFSSFFIRRNFAVLRALSLNITVFWEVIPCNLAADRYQHV